MTEENIIIIIHIIMPKYVAILNEMVKEASKSFAFFVQFFLQVSARQLAHFLEIGLSVFLDMLKQPNRAPVEYYFTNLVQNTLSCLYEPTLV